MGIIEIDDKTAQTLLEKGEIQLSTTGDENSYYKNKFNQIFLCKNYPEENAMYIVEWD
jgi:hypothetical protein